MMPKVESLEGLMEAAQGYQRSMALFTALRFDVFSRLADAPSDARNLARKVSADPRALAILLNALVAMGLLRKSGETYRNTPLARDFLAEGPRSKRSILLHQLDCWGEWTGLEGKVRRGGKLSRREGEYQENFIRGMEDNARERAAEVAIRIPLMRGERVLDLGGGPGTYAVEWARRYPGAVLTLFDSGDTLRITKKILREKGVLGLVLLREGDFFTADLGGPYDFAWISHILHAYSEKDCLSILRRVRAALRPGGRIAIQEFLLDESRTAPPGPAFFSVHMLAVTEGGRAYSAGEVAAMLRSAGFREVAIEDPDPRGVGIVRGYGGSCKS